MANRQWYKKRSVWSAIVLSAALLIGGDTSGLAKEAPVRPPLHTWVVYWDREDGLAELRAAEAAGMAYKGVSYFGAQFDEKDRLYVIPKAVPVKDAATAYLTFVNDIVGTGISASKDTAVVARVLANRSDRERHAEEVITLAMAQGAAGIEMDYEQVWKDEALSKKYTDFLAILYKKAQRRGIPVRVMLDPGGRYKEISLPNGPTYVIMAYNLYGVHSKEPGPKADYAFLRKMMVSLQHVPAPKGLALSAGGAYWSSDGQRRFLSTPEALALAASHEATPIQDPLSGAWHFSYTDEKGHYNTVWYGDKDTITKWMAAVTPYGLDTIGLWRMGDHETVYGWQ